MDNIQLREKSIPPQLPRQTLPTCPATKPDFVDKPTRDEVEARPEAYTASFEVDVSKIPQSPKDVSAPGLYYLLSDKNIVCNYASRHLAQS